MAAQKGITATGVARCVAARAHLFFDQAAMKLRDTYNDWRVTVGFALIVLGAANCAIGLRHTQRYGRILAQTPAATAPDQAYRSFDELGPRASRDVLRPFISEQWRVSYARARMDFYHVTFLTGQVLSFAGIAIALLGFIGLIQRDSRRAVAMRHAPPRAS